MQFRSSPPLPIYNPVYSSGPLGPQFLVSSSATLWYYHIVEFIEARVFTRRLHQLANDSADEVLRAIQGDLETKPDRGAMVPGLGGVRKARIANPGRGKGETRWLPVLVPVLGK